MSLESDIAVFREVPLFSQLSNEQLRLLAFGAEHRRLRAGETLFRAQSRADAGFVVAEGRMAMHRGLTADAAPVAVYSRGALIGEMALLTETRRPVTAIAETDCDIIRITRPLFRRMLEEYPEIAVALHEKIANDLAQMTVDIVGLEERFTD